MKLSNSLKPTTLLVRTMHDVEKNNNGINFGFEGTALSSTSNKPCKVSIDQWLYAPYKLPKRQRPDGEYATADVSPYSARVRKNLQGLLFPASGASLLQPCFALGTWSRTFPNMLAFAFEFGPLGYRSQVSWNTIGRRFSGHTDPARNPHNGVNLILVAGRGADIGSAKTIELESWGRAPRKTSSWDDLSKNMQPLLGITFTSDESAQLLRLRKEWPKVYGQMVLWFENTFLPAIDAAL